MVHAYFVVVMPVFLIIVLGMSYCFFAEIRASNAEVQVVSMGFVTRPRLG